MEGKRKERAEQTPCKVSKRVEGSRRRRDKGKVCGYGGGNGEALVEGVYFLYGGGGGGGESIHKHKNLYSYFEVHQIHPFFFRFQL